MQYVNINEASKILNVNEETVRRWIRSGKLKAEKHGGRIGYRIDKKILDDFILENKFWKPHSDCNTHYNNKSTDIDSKINDNSKISAINIKSLSGCLGACSVSPIPSILGSVVGNAIGNVLNAFTLGIMNGIQSNSHIHDSDINIYYKNNLKLYHTNINSLIKTINLESESLIDNNFTITSKDYINFIDNISKLQYELSLYLCMIEEFKLKLLNITEDKITSNNK